MAKRSSRDRRREPIRRQIPPRHPVATRSELGKARLPTDEQLVNGWQPAQGSGFA